MADDLREAVGMADNVSLFSGPRPQRRFHPEPVISDEPAKKRERQSPRRLSIAVVAGLPLIRDLLIQWLNHGNAAITTFASTEDLVRHLQGDGAPRLDLVVIGCPTLTSEEIRAAVPAQLPGGAPIIVVASAEESGLIAGLIQQGVRGYVPTRLEPDVADAAVKLVLAGGVYLPPCAMGQPATVTDGAGAAEPSGDLAKLAERVLGLTHREAEVLMALKAGLSNRDMSGALGISESTVMVHIRNLMHKVGASNRTQAVYMALRRLNGARATAAGAAAGAKPARD